VKQQINFARGGSKTVRFALNVRTLLWAGGAVAVILMGVTAFDARGLNSLKQRVDTARQQANAMQDQVQQLETELTAQVADSRLVAETERRQREVDELRELLNSVRGNEWDQRGGFAAYFEALARQTRPAMWLREIRFRDGGSRIELAGSALKTDDIPEMVQSLGLEEAFKARTFQDLTIRRPQQQQGQIDFVLRTEIPETEKRGKP